MKVPFSIQEITSKSFDFKSFALRLFQYQACENKVYNKFIHELGINPGAINSITDIPFMPVEFFKKHRISTAESHEKIFTSSSTTGSTPSSHYVYDLSVYEASFQESFKLFYGNPNDYCILALLPGYLEREGSSLVYMAEKLIQQSNNSNSGFYLHNFEDLIKILKENEAHNIKTLLLGVTFGLLDFAEQYNIPLKNTIIMETGGMKGRRKEMIRQEIHEILMNRFHIKSVHSEYGMTELLSQAYSYGDGLYKSPQWMKVIPYDFYNPLHCMEYGKGGVNIIDLANIYSCAFIQTSDIGNVHQDGSFEILGRFDESEIRGCNLMVL
jgi:phenylacetate-coenzyme A ligase PaaK-like adenylate-forming protein